MINDECCAPEMCAINGVWTPVHEQSCTRGSLEQAKTGVNDDTTLDDCCAARPIAAGEFMDRFDAYRRGDTSPLADPTERAR